MMWTRKLGQLAAIYLILTWTGTGVVLPGVVNAQETDSASAGESPAKPDADETPEEEEVEPQPWELFVPDFEDHDLEGTEDRAWEYRPYRVAVWFCLDGSPSLNALHPKLSQEITRRSELLDPSGWDLTTGLAPAKFRDQFLKHLENPERCQGFRELKSLEDYDKIMLVCLNHDASRVMAKVREFDVQTQQWGPISIQSIANLNALGARLMAAIEKSFMPLTRIDRVTEIEEEVDGRKTLSDEVVMQVRAVKSCVRSRWMPKSEEEMAADLQAATGEREGDPYLLDRYHLVAQASESAPSFISPDDRLLPVIRRTDRQGNLLRLEPLEFTFLTIKDIDGAVLRSSIQSYRRAPLAQRKSKRAQKLALVIRPPQQPTTLKLISMTSDEPMEGFEVYSRQPNQPKDEASEFLGKSDWQGELEIPPNEEGLRIVLIKRGARPLRRLPIIPGLYASVVSELPNDETRLFAEGVFQGLENEVLSLIIQRKVIKEEVLAALKKQNKEDANAAYTRLNDLERLADMKSRISSAASDLKFRTQDNREVGYIDNMLQTLTRILDREIQGLSSASQESEDGEPGEPVDDADLLRQILQLPDKPPTQSTN